MPDQPGHLPEDNPFARPSGLPYGLPPFDLLRAEHFRPAFAAGMAEHRAEVEAIAALPGPPRFADTVEALERSGRLLARVTSVFFNLTSTSSTTQLQEIESEVAPALSAHWDAVTLDPRLYARISAVHAERGATGPDGTALLDAEQVRLVERYHRDLVRAGAALPAAEQERLRALNAELSALTTAFQSALLTETNELAVHVEDAAQLAGLPEDALAGAQEAARARGYADGYLLTLALPTDQPFLALIGDRAVRERLYRAAVSRGARGGANDTRETLARIASLRARRAGLLGYPSHAAWVVEDQTAGTLEAVLSMLGGLVAPALDNVRVEAAELEAALVADGEQAPLRPWDWAYYAERLKRSRLRLDSAAVRPYLELGRVVREGIFGAAHALYGLRFTQRHDLPTYDDDVEVYEVFDSDGAALGLFLADWFARDSKRGGAWMSTFVDQSHLLGDHPVVVIALNVPRPAAGEPALLTPELVRTAFHEFGHVLHGLLSAVTYPRFSGTSVPRDFVEFPSQVNEMWAWWPEVLQQYAVHHRTGEALAPEIALALAAADSQGQGFATLEILAAALLDLEWHRLGAGDGVAQQDVEAFEADALARHGVDHDLVPPRYRSSYFAHVFAGGYSAGYYSYLWSEVLDADTVDWFATHGGLRRENGERFRRLLLSRGGAADPMECYEAMVGRPPRVEPLLARRQLLVSPQGSPADQSASSSAGA